MNKKNKKILRNIFIGIGSVIGFIVVMCLIFIAIDYKSAHTTFNDRAIDACNDGQRMVQNVFLKSPSTAEFPSCNNVNARPYSAFNRTTLKSEIINGTYYISSYVDSQNSFGAMIRTHYDIIYTDNGRSEYVINIEFE